MAALLLFGTGPGRAAGTIVTYGSRPAFDTATTGLTTIGFEGIAPPDGFVPFGNAGSLTLSGVTFQTHIGVYLYVNSSSYYTATDGPPGYNLDSGDYLLAGSGAPSFLSIALPVSATAIAFDFGTFDNSTSQATISTTPGGGVLTASAPYPTHTFIGFTSPVPISALQISVTSGDRQDTLSLDGFAFGTAIIPEPSTIALLGIGLTILLACQRRR